MFTVSPAFLDLSLLPWAPVWTAARRTRLCTSDSVWRAGKSQWNRPAGASGMTPTAAWPWCSSWGAGRTRMPPKPVYRCPGVSRLTLSTQSLLWGSPRPLAPGNTRPGQGGWSGKQETTTLNVQLNPPKKPQLRTGKDSGVVLHNCLCLWGCYHEKQLQVQACDWPQSDDEEV